MPMPKGKRQKGRYLAMTDEMRATAEVSLLRKTAKEAKAAMMAVRVKEASSEDAVKAVLRSCAGVRDMARVFKAVTGLGYAGRMAGVKREDVNAGMAHQIMIEREKEKFTALSIDEKYEELKTHDDTMNVLLACPTAELEELAQRAGADTGKYAGKPEREKREKLAESIEDKMDIARLEKMVGEEAGMNEIYRFLMLMSLEALTEAALSAGIKAESTWELADILLEHYREERALKILEAVKEAGSADTAREILRKSDTSVLERVAEKAGADFHERIAEVKAKEVSREELIEWAISWILDRLGKETPLIVKMMGVRKVKNAYTYIRGMRTIKMMLLGNVLAEDVKESLPKLSLDELKGMSAGFGKPVDFDCEDDEMAEGLRNLVAGEIFYLRVGKKKIADYLSEDEKEMYADYLAGNPRLVGRSW